MSIILRLCLQLGLELIERSQGEARLKICLILLCVFAEKTSHAVKKLLVLNSSPFHVR